MTTVTSDRVTVLAHIAELQDLDLTRLREQWRALFGTAPPGFGREMMRSRLIYRVQELAYGGISEATRQRLREIDRMAQETAARAAEPDRPVAGTLIIKEHGGERHEVIVLVQGFQYRGQRFESLSHIARAITGTNWNGWRFFGLRRQKVAGK
ncbi:MAG: DUF2924 domain-containing protein [Planctomycetes bacterium]|nr:DUF2924 domain-containing protein [Planctomycetota bacterium]